MDLEEYSVQCQLCRKNLVTKIEQGNIENWDQGELLTKCFPDIPDDKRSELISGSCGSCLVELSKKVSDGLKSDDFDGK